MAITWSAIREVKTVYKKKRVINYPTETNWKATDTSKGAAESMVSKAATLRAQVYAKLQEKPMSADAVAEALGETPFSIRPRLSELKNKGLIMDSGDRDVNESLKSAIIWKVNA